MGRIFMKVVLRRNQYFVTNTFDNLYVVLSMLRISITATANVMCFLNINLICFWV